jgi:hypothetical protein
MKHTTLDTGSPFDSKSLPAWDHQHEFDSIRGKYFFKAQSVPSIQRLRRIGGTTGDYYNAIQDAFPESIHPKLYKSFPNVSSDSVPYQVVAAMLRDN